MRVLIYNGKAYLIPCGMSDWEAACKLNPGLLPDETEAYELEALPETEAKR